MIKTQARLNFIHRSRGEHCHSFPQLLLGLRGTTDCEFQSTGGAVSAEWIAIVPRRATHFFTGKNADSILLVVDLNTEQIMQNTPPPGYSLQWADGLFDEPRFIRMSKELRQLTVCAAGQLKRPMADTELLTFQWATLLTAQTHLLLAEQPAKSADERIAFDRLVDAHLSSPPSNRELQSALGMSSTRLNTWTHRRFGMTPQRRVLERRLHWARHWLITTEKPIGHIAHELGFCDSSAFTHACRRVLRMMPREIRRRGRTETI